MRLTRKRALAPEALSLSQAARKPQGRSSALKPTEALDALEATMLRINAIEQALSEARELVADAGRSEWAATRALLAERLCFLRRHIDTLAQESDAPVNLIGGGQDTLELALDGEGRERMLVAHFNLTAGREGLSLSPVKGKLAQKAEIARLAKELDAASARLRSVAEVIRKGATRLADHIERTAPVVAQDDDAQQAAADRPAPRFKQRTIKI
jgi:hypothetical protein